MDSTRWPREGTWRLAGGGTAGAAGAGASGVCGSIARPGVGIMPPKPGGIGPGGGNPAPAGCRASAGPTCDTGCSRMPCSGSFPLAGGALADAVPLDACRVAPPEPPPPTPAARAAELVAALAGTDEVGGMPPSACGGPAGPKPRWTAGAMLAEWKRAVSAAPGTG